MIVQCPNCRTKYNLPDDRVGPDGAQVRCSRCGHEFKVYPEADNRPDDSDLDDLLGDLSMPEDATGEEPRARGVPDEVLSEDDAPLTETLEVTEDEDRRFDLDLPPPPAETRKKRALLIVMAILVFLGIGAGAVSYLGLWSKVPGVSKLVQAPAADKGQSFSAEAVKSISLENVRQYYVNNEKIGQLFVIEGKAVNNFDSPRELIKVQAGLFDENGVSLASKELLAGNTVSLYQLQVMSQEELEAALNSQVGILTSNTNLKTGADTPFMIVFYNPSESVKEFGLKVIDAKTPPK